MVTDACDKNCADTQAPDLGWDMCMYIFEELGVLFVWVCYLWMTCGSGNYRTDVGLKCVLDKL